MNNTTSFGFIIFTNLPSFRDEQIDSLSRINHKNFVNLLGFCEEEEPFTRMMVLEYAPNGTLHENLHGIENLWILIH